MESGIRQAMKTSSSEDLSVLNANDLRTLEIDVNEYKKKLCGMQAHNLAATMTFRKTRPEAEHIF